MKTTRSITLLLSAVLLLSAGPLPAGQEPWKDPEFAEPGADQPQAAPDILLPSRPPEVVLQDPENWARVVEFLREFYKEYKIPQEHRSAYVFSHDGTVRFRFGGSVLFDFLREDEEFFYLRQLSVDDPRSAGAMLYSGLIQNIFLEEAWREYYEDKFVLNPEDFVAAGFEDALRFEDFSQGLPTSGLWQLGVAVADFDGDGRPDIVLPPARRGDGEPRIYLQRPGGWQPWAVRWPAGLALDYGDVVAADFDGDGHLDLALGCHFLGTYVLFGDGRGSFERYVAMPRLPTTSRALAVGDLNGNGRPDLIALNELDIDRATSQAKTTYLLTAFINPGGRGPWRAVDVSAGRDGFFGDSVALVDLDGDGALDVAIASMKATMGLFFLNREAGERWEVVESTAFPLEPWVPSVTALPGVGEPDGVAMGVYQRIAPGGGRQHVNAVITVRRTPEFDPRAVAEPEGWNVKVVNLFAGEFTRYTALAAGDLSGNGQMDLVAGRQDGLLEVYLRRGDEYFVELSPELGLGGSAGRVHALRLADLDGDGRPDIVAVVGGADGNDSQVRVFLTRPAEHQAPSRRGRR